MSANLSRVPPEILTQMFGLLEGYQIARCGAVCSYFKRVIEGSSGLQYLVKLDMFGYTDVSESVDAAAAPAMRLNQLERHIDAWNHLDWVESRVDAPLPSSDFGVICEGIFATFDYWRVYCIQLPHLMRGIPFREWTLKKFSFPIDEIEIDPSNNLLVVVSMAVDHPDPAALKTVTLHLRTLSDNSPHPRAISPSLFSVRIDRGYPMVRVMGHLLGVTLCFRRELRVEIWDWMIGEKLTVVENMRYLDPFRRRYSPFEFLSATSLVVGNQGVLEVYEIRVETPGTPPVHTASFCMPRPNLDEYRSSIFRNRDSHLSHRIQCGNLWECSSFPVPSFRLAEDTCYLTIRWAVCEGPDFVRGLETTLHVPLSSLRRLLRMQMLWKYPGKSGRAVSISRMALQLIAG
ncbi:hypothetical protein BS47DRAFT_1487509 [Hydnum rufescens UP504]|uniref:F-box domain-containing protein n=1 Tax=Hydnum rufescens UP504 TaxID=1448309 RepID=A0A9P6AR03_9AGAM|nr:hypothetical protein BS47DRAFT_1487509 [Hydnum rufescens UP504]